MEISVYDDTGYIVAAYDLPDGVTIDDIPVGGGTVLGNYDPDEIYVLAGVATDRPALFPDTDITIRNDGATVTLAVLPANTVVYDTYNSIEYTNVSSENLQVRSYIVGEFDIDVTPPFPYLAQTLEVNVNAA